MAVDGTWTLNMQTPMGDRQSSVTLKSEGGALTGTQSADGNSTEIFEGAVNGNSVSWKVSITSPMPLTLAYTGTVEGDQMSGSMGISGFGSWPYSGSRA